MEWRDDNVLLSFLPQEGDIYHIDSLSNAFCLCTSGKVGWMEVGGGVDGWSQRFMVCDVWLRMLLLQCDGAGAELQSAHWTFYEAYRFKLII